jgi:hypothetical protein
MTGRHCTSDSTLAPCRLETLTAGVNGPSCTPGRPCRLRYFIPPTRMFLRQSRLEDRVGAAVMPGQSPAMGRQPTGAFPSAVWRVGHGSPACEASRRLERMPAARCDVFPRLDGSLVKLRPRRGGTFLVPETLEVVVRPWLPWNASSVSSRPGRCLGSSSRERHSPEGM